MRIETEVVLHVRADGCTLDDGTPIAGQRRRTDRAGVVPAGSDPRRAGPTDQRVRSAPSPDRPGNDVSCTSATGPASTAARPSSSNTTTSPTTTRVTATVVDELKLRCWKCHRARHRKQREQAAAAASDHQA